MAIKRVTACPVCGRLKECGYCSHPGHRDFGDGLCGVISPEEMSYLEARELIDKTIKESVDKIVEFEGMKRKLRELSESNDGGSIKGEPDGC